MAMLRVSADLSQVPAIREFVASAGRELGLSESVIWDLKLAVDEACTNVIRHAYRGQGGELEVAVERVECGIRVVIHDWGAPFDPQAIPVPNLTLPLEQRPLGGLGLFFMRQVMDRVEYRFDQKHGNTLTMIKSVNGRE
jgi:serine/threonine-protein kinase RsbW